MEDFSCALSLLAVSEQRKLIIEETRHSLQQQKDARALKYRCGDRTPRTCEDPAVKTDFLWYHRWKSRWCSCVNVFDYHTKISGLCVKTKAYEGKSAICLSGEEAPGEMRCFYSTSARSQRIHHCWALKSHTSHLCLRREVRWGPGLGKKDRGGQQNGLGLEENPCATPYKNWGSFTSVKAQLEICPPQLSSAQLHFLMSAIFSGAQLRLISYVHGVLVFFIQGP